MGVLANGCISRILPLILPEGNSKNIASGLLCSLQLWLGLPYGCPIDQNSPFLCYLLDSMDGLKISILLLTFYIKSVEADQ